MNPLGINFERFVIAEDSASGQFLGFGQLAPLGGPGVLELRSLIVEPECRCTADVHSSRSALLAFQTSLTSIYYFDSIRGLGRNIYGMCNVIA